MPQLSANPFPRGEGVASKGSADPLGPRKAREGRAERAPGRPVISTGTIQAYLLILPAIVMLAAFTHIPAIATLIESLYSTPRGNRAAHFIGLDQYRSLIDDPVFWQALSNNFKYAAVTIPASVILALAMALAVDSKLPGRAALRLAYFTPTMLPMIAVANIFLFFFTPDYGLLDQLGHLIGLGRHNWLGDPALALPSMMAVAVWKEAGFFMIFYLAALQAIPPHLKEAAALEGAGRFTVLRRVTLPLLMPTTLFVVVNAVINAFRLIDHIIVMTRGGPDNSTTLLLYYIYETGFRFWDSGAAAALTVVLLMILGALAAFQFGVLGRRVHYR